jgi:hypothetical protein
MSDGRVRRGTWVPKDPFPSRWIGRATPIAWPTSSPDLTPMDFFLWGLVKGRVLVTLPANVVELRTGITAAVAEVTSEMARNWLQVGSLPSYQWKSHWTKTIRGKTRRVLTLWQFQTLYMSSEYISNTLHMFRRDVEGDKYYPSISVAKPSFSAQISKEHSE